MKKSKPRTFSPVSRAKTTAKNSGIFSARGSQKMDGPTPLSPQGPGTQQSKGADAKTLDYALNVPKKKVGRPSKDMSGRKLHSYAVNHGEK